MAPVSRPCLPIYRRHGGFGKRGGRFRPPENPFFPPRDAVWLATLAAGGYDPRPASRALSEGPAMAKGKKRLEVIHLVCEETGDQNYTLRRKSGGEKLKVKKYSPRLRKHTLHLEKKK
jgi:large subunit ribosomal protein L33